MRESAGLCAHCHFLQVLRSKTSTFVRCGLSDRDDRFPRYPPLPRYACDGHRPADPVGDVVERPPAD